MNLSVLERMVRDGDLSLHALRYLVDCHSECEWLDYKEFLTLDTDRAIANFTRDVLAMKNTGGGYIVVGVKDKTWEPVGLQQSLPYDSKLLRDKVRRGCGLELEVDIVQHKTRYFGVERDFALILTRGSRKRNKRRVPSLVKSDFLSKERYGLRRGEIYARRGDSTVRVDSSELLDILLSELEDRADSDDLETDQTSSSFAIDSGTYRLQAPDFDVFIGRSALRQQVVDAVLKDPRIWIVNIHGPGGVGKSAIATWAAYHFYEQKRFESIIQLTAKETALTEKGIRRYRGRTLHSLEDLLDRICTVFEEDPPENLDDKRQLTTELLSAWTCLLILDNMETVNDGRILEFVQTLPPNTRAKVLITSRHRTGGWEFPVTVNELNLNETREFVGQKSLEMQLDVPLDDKTCGDIRLASGGLPLAIQWLLGRYRSTSNLAQALEEVDSRSSPVLEFSFRNIWNILSTDARTVLAVLSIFDEPPPISLVSVVTEWSFDRIQVAANELAEVTLISLQKRPTDDREVLTALPITLHFSRYQLEKMGDLEVRVRRAYQQYTQQMELRSWEVERFASIFTRYNITNDNEKRAAILCRRGESETFAGNLQGAGDLFSQARDLAPNSAYVYAMSANFELAAQNVGAAQNLADRACRYANTRTGSLAWGTKARACNAESDRYGQIRALRKALEYDPQDHILRHQLGVALSRAKETEAAIGEFTRIINDELAVEVPSETLVMALKTRIINLRRVGRTGAAEADLLLAHELLDTHPHLARQRPYIEELDL